MDNATAATAPRRTQTIRFARPEALNDRPQAPRPPQPRPPPGLLHDQVLKHTRGPWCPSFSVAFRIILLVRVSAAVYSNISDCDEVYNFWEPLHYVDQGFGFQTWETSPTYALRSWAYIMNHLLPAKLPMLLNLDKRASFFAVRMALGLASTVCEARFYRSVVENINRHVGRYTLVLLAVSAGMWSASTAFLPSSFSMMCNALAFSFAMKLPSRLDNQRTYWAVACFVVGGLVGWPFALAIAIPFVFEEAFMYGKDKIKQEVRSAWMIGRWIRLIQGGLLASLVLLPVIAIDSLAYGELTISPWNLIKYNVCNSAEKGSTLYGTEPWYFYLLNLLLNFNVALPLALLSLPALFITRAVEYKRLGPKPGPDESSPYSLMTIRLLPLYLWIGFMSLQPHKEERFMFPIYPLLCFNAAVMIYLVRGWIEVAYIKATSSPYKASKSPLFGNITLSILILSIFISISRILALAHYYHAPLDVVFHFQNIELPRLLNVTGLLTKPKVPLNDNSTSYVSTSRYDEDIAADLSPLKAFGGIRLCYGKEWYRFPGHYLVPNGVEVQFIKSEFDGLLPGHFIESNATSTLWKRPGTRIIPTGMNDENKEEPSHHVDVSTCDYLVDSDFPHRPDTESKHEPRYAAQTGTWERVHCLPFLDAPNSGRVSRLLWFPGTGENGVGFDGGNVFGDYCLLKHKQRAIERESRVWVL